MKISAFAFATIFATTQAFVPATMPRASITRRSVVTDPTETTVNSTAAKKTEPKAPVATPATAASPTPIEVDAKEVFFLDVESNVNARPLQPGRYNSLKYSKALPFFERPPYLDGSHAGDMGFDPCGLGETFDLYYMQECELRHARLAMLAVVGWPLSEMVAPGFMLQDGRAPSVLNGFNIVSALSVFAALSALALFEFQTSLRRTIDTPMGKQHKKDMSAIWEYGVAGDYNFDPLGLYSMLGIDAQGRKAMRQMEIIQGRFAMLGITYFAWAEASFGKPIVQDNIFFHPNPILPLIAISYFVWSQFYQLSDVRKYPITIGYTKDGEEMLRGLKRSIAGGQAE